ncbi:MAG: acetyl-CoA C-acetyltransferase, partial [Betaproteobacteria bacterium]|nr:acetyl-CoA C-acetyltransferase [Betaproteobacteria bacterium]
MDLKQVDFLGLPAGFGKELVQGTDRGGGELFSRQAQDAFAIRSTQRAQQANDDGSFAWEIAAVSVPGKKGEQQILRDEQPFKAQLDKIPGLRP